MKTIVAELSKNWPSDDTELISKKFERIIGKNLERGFVLDSWRYTMVATPASMPEHGAGMCESIIAVFIERKNETAKRSCGHREKASAGAGIPEAKS